MAIKLNVKYVNIIWHVLPFQLRPDAVGAASRRIAFCIATYRQLRRDAVLGHRAHSYFLCGLAGG